MLSVVRDEGASRPERLDAAKAAAPYVHQRLASLHVEGSPGPKSIVELTDEELARIAAGRRTLLIARHPTLVVQLRRAVSALRHDEGGDSCWLDSCRVPARAAT